MKYIVSESIKLAITSTLVDISKACQHALCFVSASVTDSH
jgi:hypothetical protein